jgi:hypothetical protein
MREAHIAAGIDGSERAAATAQQEESRRQAEAPSAAFGGVYLAPVIPPQAPRWLKQASLARLQRTHGNHFAQGWIHRAPTESPDGDVVREINQIVEPRVNNFALQLVLATDEFGTWYKSQPELDSNADIISELVSAALTKLVPVPGLVISIIMIAVKDELTKALDPNASLEKAVLTMQTSMRRTATRMLTKFANPADLIQQQMPKQYKQLVAAFQAKDTAALYTILEEGCGVPSKTHPYATEMLGAMIAAFRETEMRERGTTARDPSDMFGPMAWNDSVNYLTDRTAWRRWNEAKAAVEANERLGTGTEAGMLAVVQEYMKARQAEVKSQQRLAAELRALAGPQFDRIAHFLTLY